MVNDTSMPSQVTVDRLLLGLTSGATFVLLVLLSFMSGWTWLAVGLFIALGGAQAALCSIAVAGQRDGR